MAEAVDLNSIRRYPIPNLEMRCGAGRRMHMLIQFRLSDCIPNEGDERSGIERTVIPYDAGTLNQP